MDTGEFHVLQSVDAQDAIAQALERGTGKMLGAEARAKALRDVDAVLEVHRRAFEADLDQWMTKKVRDRAAKELDVVSQHLDRALDALRRLSPLAETALRPNVFDPASPLGKLLAEGLRAGTLKTAMRVYLDHFRTLVGVVDSVQAMVKVLAAERSSDKPEDWPAVGFDGSDGAFVPPLEDLVRSVRRYATLARIKAENLRTTTSAASRRASGLDRVVTLGLMAIWLEFTGEEASVAYWSHGEENERVVASSTSHAPP